MAWWKILAFIAAAILILFGVLFIWGAMDASGGGGNWIVIGIVSVGIGFGLIYFGARKPASDVTNVTLKIDLPGNVGMDSLKCKSCGGTLASKDVSMVAGAPVVTCPYCGSTYQLTEEPKW